jgi:MerR family transcriptional regulator/heat shock protein HspR
MTARIPIQPTPAPRAAPPSTARPDGRNYTIGHVAHLICVSPQTLRYYEKEGLIIPQRSNRGTRRYNEEDILRLRRVREMIVQEGLNVSGIRHMLAMLPCWEIKHCDRHSTDCAQQSDDQHPCWTNPYCICRVDEATCRDCIVYRHAFDFLSVRRVLDVHPGAD